jgi:hypothetical protein
MRPLTRITPVGQPGDYRTFSIASPTDRSVRAACEQVGCAARRNGWQTTVDESTDLGKQQAAYIRQRSGRTFREQRTGAGLTVFTFESGQRCFADHRTRPEIFAVQGGDWRQQTGPAQRHQRPADWVEDFQENQGRLAELHARG